MTMKKLLPTRLTLRLHLAAVLFAALVGQAAAQNNLTNGLVAYYPFNGKANDASGNGNDGVAYGTTYGVDRFGTPNSTASFNGSSYIDTTYGAKTFGKITVSSQ